MELSKIPGTKWLYNTLKIKIDHKESAFVVRRNIPFAFQQSNENKKCSNFSGNILDLK